MVVALNKLNYPNPNKVQKGMTEGRLYTVHQKLQTEIRCKNLNVCELDIVYCDYGPISI